MKGIVQATEVSKRNFLINEMVETGHVEKLANLQHKYFKKLRDAGFSTDQALMILLNTKLLGYEKAAGR